MADIDWPTGEHFAIANPLRVSLETSKSGWQGFYTGNRQTLSHPADRFVLQMALPPVLQAWQADERAAFLAGVISRGDRIRLRMPHHTMPRGTLRGSPTVAASVAAGARSLNIAGAMSGPNLISGGGFELDSDGDGATNGWSVSVPIGTSGVHTKGRAAGPLIAGADGAWYQTQTATALSGRLQVSRVVPEVVPGRDYALAVDVSCTAGLTLAISINWLDATSTYLSEAYAGGLPTSAGRRAVSGIAPAAAAYAFLAVYADGVSGAAAILNTDNAQFERRAVPSPYSGPATLAPGDWLGVGGNLVQVDYPGANFDDAGAGAVPLVTPLQRPITAGAAVTWAAPTGLWELQDSVLDITQQAAWWQDPIVLNLRQAIA